MLKIRETDNIKEKAGREETSCGPALFSFSLYFLQISSDRRKSGGAMLRLTRSMVAKRKERGRQGRAKERRERD